MNIYDPSLCLTSEVPSAEMLGVGVAVEVGAGVSVEVGSGVFVEGLACAVCIAAALAVPATIVEIEFGSGVGNSDGAESPGNAQAKVKNINKKNSRFRCDLFMEFSLT